MTREDITYLLTCTSDPKAVAILVANLSGVKKIKPEKVYKLPTPSYKGKYNLRKQVGDYKVHVGAYVTAEEYWVAHAQIQKLFAKGSKGMADLLAMPRDKVTEYVRYAVLNR